MKKSAVANAIPLHEMIFNTDGTLRGVTYSNASKRRGAVLSVNINKYRQNAIRTSFGVDDRDFRAVYKNVVAVLAALYDVTSDIKLVAKMESTSDLFLKVNGLVLRPVVIKFEQVTKASLPDLM